MSGLYTMVLGRHPLAPQLLQCLGFISEEEVLLIPRLRDVYLFPDEIRILTRTGGGNRDDYLEPNEWLRDREGFTRDYDDAYDSTYAWWAYRWPEEYKKVLTPMLELLQEARPDLIPESDSIRERFDDAIERMGKTNDD
jgi:hypothetical protein